MREKYEGHKHPGKFEGNGTPMIQFIHENDLFDENDGDVEGFFWFGRAGKWVITENDQGFVGGGKCHTEQAAREEFEELAAEYTSAFEEIDDDT